jgi:hypothetical protein
MSYKLFRFRRLLPFVLAAALLALSATGVYASVDENIVWST